MKLAIEYVAIAALAVLAGWSTFYIATLIFLRAVFWLPDRWLTDAGAMKYELVAILLGLVTGAAVLGVVVVRVRFTGPRGLFSYFRPKPVQ